MKSALLFVAILLAGSLPGSAFATQEPLTATASQIAIVLDVGATPVEQAAAQVLLQRLQAISTLQSFVGESEAEEAQLRIYLGIARETGRLHDLAAQHGLAPPARADHRFAEGFAAAGVLEPAPMLLAVAAEDRALLYAVGEIVRRLRFEKDAVTLSPFRISSSPGFRYRGFSTNQGGTMMKITGARGWTTEEMHEAVLEYTLAGANTFYADGAMYDFVKSFGLMTVTGARPNQLEGPFPEEWKAGGREEWEGKKWVCPSIPEARAALLAQWDKDFAARQDHDVMRFYAGDPGGCTDARCTPWGKTFVHLCEEMAALWLKHHPNSTIQIANQGLDNAGDQAILDYLNEQPRPWSYGLCYGPGSNAMNKYFRDIDLRDDLFEYPGHGPVNRYVRELLHQLPIDQKLVHYSDITHYISAQFAAENPDPYLVKSYGRRTFHARPRAMYNIFQRIMPFSEGDIIYSEGNHDEFHQYLWARLLWNPNYELETLMMEYCTLYFGEEAAPAMVQALLQLEENLEAPLAENAGITRYAELVRAAGEQMPAWRMERDFKWRLHMQKALLDQYIQQKLRIELEQEQRVRALLETALQADQAQSILAEALAVLQEPRETEEMAAWRKEAGTLGEDTDRLHGDRIPGFFRLDQSLRDLPGLEELLKAALSAEGPQVKASLEKALEKTQAPADPGRIFW